MYLTLVIETDNASRLSAFSPEERVAEGAFTAIAWLRSAAATRAGRL